MTNKHRTSVVAIAIGLATVGCSSDDNSASTMNTGTLLSNVPSDGTFFNADAGLDFASVVGGNLSNVSARALNSSSDVFGNASQSDDPASGLYNDDTSVDQCDSGSISHSISTNTSNELENASIVFNNCVIDGQISSGSMSFATQSTGSTETLLISFDNFSTSGSDGESLIDGDVRLIINDDLAGSLNGTSMTMVADGETVVFSDYSLTFQSDIQTGESTMGGQATITSSVDGQINFSINPAFTGSEDGNPTSGIITMTHEDGSWLTIDAGTGNPATYAYTINGGGAITSGVGNWDDEEFTVPAF